MSRRADPKLRAALDETGLPWTVEIGGRHYHVRVAGRLVGVWPRSGATETGRGTKNVIAQIRRTAREIRAAGGSL